jgi:hypothetical protein
VGYPPPPSAVPKTLEAEIAESRMLEFDAWDEEFESRTGSLPPFSRLLIRRAVGSSIGILDIMKQHPFYGMCMCGCGEQNPEYLDGGLYLRGHGTRRNRRVLPG